jgi:serine/threonine protein kinase
MDLEICDGKYMLKEKIGKGAFGHVFAGFPVGYGEDVAIKLEERKNKK